MTQSAEQEIKPDFRYVKIDETQHWNESFIRALGTGTKLIATYVYDASEVTHCCELTPSHFLMYVGTEIEPGRELSDSEWETYEEQVRESEFQCDNDHYRHCRSIKDSHPVPERARGYESLEDVVEEFHANPW
jgi:hypothetical protein